MQRSLVRWNFHGLVCVMVMILAFCLTGSAAEEPTLPLAEQIARLNDLFDLYDMQNAYVEAGQTDPSVMNAFSEKRNELMAKHDRKPAIEGKLDFVDFKFERLEGDVYRLRWYYVVTSDITKEWTLKAILKVDSSHTSHLPKNVRESKRLTDVVYAKDSKINTWKAGEHKVLSITIELKTIPYDIYSRFYQWFPDKPTILTDSISHGWHVQLEP